MSVLKAAYFVDELVNPLFSILREEDIWKFYDENSYFRLDNFQEFVDFESANPLLKVAWNIINRGEPTRASISLTDYILKTHLLSEYLGINVGKSEIATPINADFFHDLDPNLLLPFLQEFRNNTEADISGRLGSKFLKLYYTLRDFILSAQIQKTILLIMLSDENISEIKITGIKPDFSAIIIQDINELLSAINALVSNKEKEVPILKLSDNPGVRIIALNRNDGHSITVLTSIDIPDQYFGDILTDRRIKYNPLGILIEEEIDGKYLQRFEYSSVKQRDALKYFLQNIFRKTSFKPGQESIINRAIQGKDVIGLLPTGGGKSLTFQLCALLHPGVTIVVDPINSLMKDQYDKLVKMGIRKSAFINSFNTKDERQMNIDRLVNKQILVLFVSPERFQIEGFRHVLSNCKNAEVYFSFAVIDEAHCVSEWGHDFRHTYLKLAQNLKRFCKPKNGPLVLFGLTATASFDVLADVQRELEMPENSIISLPAEAIDRRELNFDIVPINCEINEGLKYYQRENKIGEVKHPKLVAELKKIPKKIELLERQFGYLNPQQSFFSSTSGKYKNAGIIFCPTKSNKLANGVLSISDYLADQDYLQIGTFFGGGDDDTIRDARIENEADRSLANQESFLNDQKNIMIATKAFGMGIDKSNIRFTIHYSFPNSVESFYQEAGRAGRDGLPSICSILFNASDIETNYDFYKNSFRGIDREKQIIDELLEEVRYEDNFNLSVLKQQILEEYPEVSALRLGKDTSGNERYIYINGPYRANAARNEWITVGKIDLLRDLRSYDQAIQNFDTHKAQEIIEYFKRKLREHCPHGNYIEWIKQPSSPGIKSLLDSLSKDQYFLRIGFTNDIVTKMTEVVIENDYKDFEEIIIRAAYNFTTDENDFIENIEYQYYKFQKNNGVQYDDIQGFCPNDFTREYLLNNYYKIRNSADTQRAIYRMSIVGIIDDYVIDYIGKFIEVRFKVKPEKDYIENFRQYLRRYLGVDSTNLWIEKVNNISDPSILRKVLYVLIEFIEDEIAKKRKRSIDFMKDLCELQIEQGELEFRQRIVTYFTSKYATEKYLPADTEKGTIENADIVEKYINYIFAPPDGLGSQIDNAKHLRGACDNVRINLTGENASIDLLTSFAYFALDAKSDDTIENATARPLIKQAIELYRKGFRRLLQIEDWSRCKNLIQLFNNKALDINPVIKPLVQPLTQELLINRTSFRLKEFIDNILPQEN